MPASTFARKTLASVLWLKRYPIDLALTVVRFSNAILHFGYRLLATLTGSQRRMDRVTRIYVDFRDCVPIVKD